MNFEIFRKLKSKDLHMNLRRKGTKLKICMENPKKLERKMKAN